MESIKTKEVTKIEAVNLYSFLTQGNIQNGIIPPARQKTPLSWAVSRTISFLEKQIEEYYKDIQSLIDVHVIKEKTRTIVNGEEQTKSKLKEGKNGTSVFDYDYGSPEKEKEVEKLLREMQNEKITIRFYEAPKDKLQAYLDTNPAPTEYEPLLETIINPNLI